MKDILKQFTALLLIMAICLSLFSAGALASESSQTTDESISTQSSTSAEGEDVSVEPSVDDDSMSDVSLTGEPVDDSKESADEQAVLSSGNEREESDAGDKETDSTDAKEDSSAEESQDWNNQEQKKSNNQLNPQSTQSLSAMTENGENRRVHNLVICGSKYSVDGFSRMTEVLRDNTPPIYRNDRTVTQLHYQEGNDTGVTKDELIAKFQEVFGNSKDNDLNILYYGGHTNLSDNESPEKLQMSLHFLNNEVDIGLPAAELFEELEKFKGDFVLIMDTCYSEGYNLYGRQKLPPNNQERFRIIVAQDEDRQAWGSYWGTEDLGVLTENLLDGIGFFGLKETYGIDYGRYETMEADNDEDGCVTLSELDDYFEKERIPGSPRWNPAVYGKGLDKLRLFHFTTIGSIKEGLSLKEVKKEQITGTKLSLIAFLENDSGYDYNYHWKTSDPAIATVEGKDGAGLVSFHSEGKVTISCVLEDKDGIQFPSSEKSLKFDVKKPVIKVSPTTLTLYEKETKSLSAKVEGTTESVKWKSSDKNTATVDKKGNVTGKKAGSCIISAYLGDVEAGCMINVKEPTIKLNKESLTLDLDNSKKKSYTLKVTVDGPSKKVSWKSSNTKIATVDKNGKVKAKKAGKCKISAKANGVNAVCKVTVLSEKDKAIAAYMKFLSQDTIIWSGESYKTSDYSFTIVYIDNDSIPEIVVNNCSIPGGDGAIGAYKNGRIVFIKLLGTDFEYYPKKGVYVDCYGDYWIHSDYNTFSSGKVKKWLQYSRKIDITEEEYHLLNTKNTSTIKKKYFHELIKKKVGNVKKKKPEFYANTVANRKKHLK